MAIVADLVADPLKPRIRLKPVGAARGEDDSARAAERRRIDRGEGMLMEPLHTASGTKRRRLDDGDEDSSGTKRRLLDDGDEDCLDGDEGSRAVKRRRLDGDEGSRTVKRRSLDGDEGSPRSSAAASTEKRAPARSQQRMCFPRFHHHQAHG
ncbi:hypothetical protein GUJ93_ZPchr0007g3620 [Zizania palustris]|uniref:Uncharacterized protein n=1 Tax=Zizania palustris TaxID=103762 RepID=A0A8J5TDI6_ZIZPA|nr:hypothetical protein GUJ93_ZPchr0007g3620 [Zizania palustris]